MKKAVQENFLEYGNSVRKRKEPTNFAPLEPKISTFQPKNRNHDLFHSLKIESKTFFQSTRKKNVQKLSHTAKD